MSSTKQGKRQRFRARIEANPTLRRIYRIGVGGLGGLILLTGFVMIPAPGPGWLVIFAGLAILASEFSWIRRVLHLTRSKHGAWTSWRRRQPLPVRLAGLALTRLIVVAMLYLFNVFYLLAWLVGLDHWTWLRSPFFG